MPEAIPLEGKKFGRWLVLSLHPYRTITGHRQFLCECECSTIRVVTRANLTSGASRSCGCLKDEMRTKHGRARRGAKHDPTYSSWHHMINRCYNPNHIQYKDYGGRGIKVCVEWFDFRNFLKDMGERRPDLTLERIDNEVGYQSDNCEWATPYEQAQNRRPKEY